jgi:hypothetical protein
MTYSRGLLPGFNGWVSHVDSVTADDRSLGAQNVGGVQIRPPNYEKFSRVECVNITIIDKQQELYWNFLHEQIGKPYETLAIVAFALDCDWRSPDACLCDELVAAGLEHAGVVHKLAPCINRVDARGRGRGQCVLGTLNCPRACGQPRRRAQRPLRC